jgi:putative hemolysin
MGSSGDRSTEYAHSELDPLRGFGRYLPGRPRSGAAERHCGAATGATREEPLEEIVSEIAIILALVLANGLFAGAEIAIIGLRRTRLAQLAEEGHPSARAIRELRAHPERFLATVQVGITVVSATAAAFGGAALAERLEPALAGLPYASRYAGEIALGIVVALVSYLSLVLGELVPKSLALRASERYALLAARPLLALSTLARPLVWLLTASSNAVLRPFGDRTTFTETRLSAEEIEQLVDEAGRAGTLDEPTAEITSRALAFRELRAQDVMVPRSRIVALPRDASTDDLRRLLLEEGRTRMPVYGDSLDDVAGYVLAKDLAAMAWERGLIVLQDLVRPIHFVPATARAVNVLRELQRRRIQLAIVVDEHGGVAGLVTLEDLVEELVGEIVGEREEPEPLFRPEPGGTTLVRADAPLREVNRELELQLPEGEGYSTLAGLCIALAGAVPERGARLRAPEGTEIEVVEATPRVVRLVRLKPPPRPEPPEGGSGAADAAS